MILGLRTVIYPAPDLARAKRWYSEVLGQPPYFDQPFYVGFNVGGFELGLLPDGTPGTGGPQALWGVADAAAAHARLLALGATALEPVTEVGGRHPGGGRDRPLRQPPGHHREPAVRRQVGALSRLWRGPAPMAGGGPLCATGGPRCTTLTMTRRTATRLLTALAATLVTGAALAQAPTPPAAPAAPAPLPYATVAQALAGLKARDGDGTIVTDGGDGWVIVNEPLASAQWTFTPAGHAAYPAVVRRVIQRGPNRAVSIAVASLCEAPAAACAELLKSFQGLNERITQAVGAQNRQPPVAR